MQLTAVQTPLPARAAPLWEIEQVRGAGEAEVRRLATIQRGLVTRGQLIDARLRRGGIAHRLDAGTLVAVHRSVYRLGHDAEVPFSRELAAALLSEGRGVLSHHSAAAIWGLWEPDPDRAVHLTVVGRDMRSRPGLQVTKARALHRDDWCLKDGLPVTSPARLVLDLATDPALDRVLNELRVKRLLIDSHLRAAIERVPNLAGAARLRALLQAEGDLGFSRSRAERRLRRLVRDAQLPLPRFNARLLNYEVDALWAKERVVVEVDGFAAHGHRQAFESDRRKDQRLQAAGYTVIRVTWWQLVREPTAVAVRIAQTLALRAAQLKTDGAPLP